MMRADDSGPAPSSADAVPDARLRGGFYAPPPLAAASSPMLGSYDAGPYSSGFAAQAPPASASVEGESSPSPLKKLELYVRHVQQRYQLVLDRATPFPAQRWGFTTGVLLVFLLRVVICEAWFLVCYALFIFLLSRFLLFLTPKFHPSFEEDQEADDLEAGEPDTPSPASSGGLMSGMFAAPPPDEEFRPFVRRLPEFTFWLSVTQATLIALAATFFSIFDVPVFWPILLFYFVVLLVSTMRRQIQHMIKYKYVPFDLGRKATY